MPTKMELTLEQTQQGVSYEVSISIEGNIRVILFTVKMEILLEPTSNKLMFDESNTNVLERFYTSAGNPVKEILLKLNLPDHRILKDGGEETLGQLMKNYDRRQRRIDWASRVVHSRLGDKWCSRSVSPTSSESRTVGASAQKSKLRPQKIPRTNEDVETGTRNP
ncbi:hypothetical protein Tco_0535991 [Tanacetum coccineum]